MLGNDQEEDLVSMENILENIPTTLTQDIREDLEKLMTIEEIRKILFSFNLDKAPSLDGYPPRLFQKYWDIVSRDIYLVV